MVVRACVYASVCWSLTAITSDTKQLFSERFALLHVLIASLLRRRGKTSAPRRSQPWLLQYLHVYSHNFHLLYLEQSAAEARSEARGTALSPAQLGFHDWEAGPDYAWLELRERRVFFFSLSFFLLQGLLKVSGGEAPGICSSLPTERGLLRVRSVITGQLLHSWSNWPEPNSLMDFRYDTKSITILRFGQKWRGWLWEKLSFFFFFTALKQKEMEEKNQG